MCFSLRYWRRCFSFKCSDDSDSAVEAVADVAVMVVLVALVLWP